MAEVVAEVTAAVVVVAVVVAVVAAKTNHALSRAPDPDPSNGSSYDGGDYDDATHPAPSSPSPVPALFPPSSTFSRVLPPHNGHTVLGYRDLSLSPILPTHDVKKTKHLKAVQPKSGGLHYHQQKAEAEDEAESNRVYHAYNATGNTQKDHQAIHYPIVVAVAVVMAVAVVAIAFVVVVVVDVAEEVHRRQYADSDDGDASTDFDVVDVVNADVAATLAEKTAVVVVVEEVRHSHDDAQTTTRKKNASGNVSTPSPVHRALYTQYPSLAHRAPYTPYPSHETPSPSPYPYPALFLSHGLVLSYPANQLA